jgi:Flp pilus assembly protein TadB
VHKSSGEMQLQLQGGIRAHGDLLFLVSFLVILLVTFLVILLVTFLMILLVTFLVILLVIFLLSMEQV